MFHRFKVGDAELFLLPRITCKGGDVDDIVIRLIEKSFE
jgi:hypothetical protein